MSEKMIRGGKVGVLISPEFGAGWSTWNDNTYKEFLLFDKTLVEMVERSAKQEEVEKYIEQKFGADHNIYMGGWPCEVVWMDAGTHFRVEEYDGSESLRYRDDDDWSMA